MEKDNSYETHENNTLVLKQCTALIPYGGSPISRNMQRIIKTEKNYVVADGLCLFSADN